MGKWKVTPEKEGYTRTRITGAVSFSGGSSEESKNGPPEEDEGVIFRSKSLSTILSPPTGLNIGSSWTEVMLCLRSSGSIFEAVNSLRNIEVILKQIPREDRLAFCKDDFEAAVDFLKKSKTLNTSNLIKECVYIQTTYFDLDRINKLPECILQTIFSYHQPHKLLDLMTTCKEWQRLGMSKPLWQDLYIQRFIPPKLVATVAARKAALDRGEEELVEDEALLPKIHVTVTDLRKSDNVAQLYRSRILKPMLLDQVEVMWKGKFRLDDNAIYSGLGWWTAQVIGYRERYVKIRYPGWSERWEEWVPRNKLRLSVGGDMDTNIKLSDIVEVWCTGQNIPGVWLLCQVKKIKRGKYGFENVCSTGMMWVDRENVRPAELSSFTRNHVKFVKQQQSERRSRRWIPASLQQGSCTIS